MRLETLERPGPDDVDDVLALVSAASAADGHPPLSEHVELHLRRGGDGADRHVLARDGSGVLAGYAHADPTDVVEGTSAEVVVRPAYRRSGLGRALVRAAEAASPDGRLRLWSHGDHPAAAALSASLGYERIRALWVMRRDLSQPLPELVVPDGVRLRSFEPAEDGADWLGVNARAFASHPEQGAWTASDLEARMAEPWFDPSGFIVAEDSSSEAMLGSHWTKVHGAAGGHAHDAIGEVYVVGVDPAAQGRRLGAVLTLAGLHHLRARGLDEVMLYVESDNAPAVRVYSGLGFAHTSTDVMYRRAHHRPV